MKRIQTNEYKNPSRIIGIQFSMLSPEEIERNSVVEVVSRETMVNNKLSVGGLFDSKMGVLEQGLYCPTDGLTYIDSPGYFGHIELAKPVFFIQHIKDIVKVLKCVCNKCGKILINNLILFFYFLPLKKIIYKTKQYKIYSKQTNILKSKVIIILNTRVIYFIICYSRQIIRNSNSF